MKFMQSLPTPGDRYTRALMAQQQGLNNGTTAGGLASVLNSGLMGMMMRDEKGKEDQKKERLANALRMMVGQSASPRPAGMPEGVELTSQATRDQIFGERTPDPMGAAGMMAQDNPELSFQVMQAEQQRRDALDQFNRKATLEDARYARDRADAQSDFDREAALKRELARLGLEGDVAKMVQNALLQDRLTRQRETDKPYIERGLPVPGDAAAAPTGGTPSLAEYDANAAAMKTAATETAKSEAAAASKQKDNERAYNTFSIGLRNLEQAMAETTTGPIIGQIPALSPEAQTAEGAIATLAPTLKNLFRESGEGIFTDKDQELLLRMVPTRTDAPAARAAKIQMIDQIVRSKLGMSDPTITDGPSANMTGTPQGVEYDYVPGQGLVKRGR